MERYFSFRVFFPFALGISQSKRERERERTKKTSSYELGEGGVPLFLLSHMDIDLEVLVEAARAPERRRRGREANDDEIDNRDLGDDEEDCRCAICLSSPERLSLRCSLLPCGHSSFCVSCVRQWFLQSRKSTCPLCLRRVSSFVDGRGTETEVVEAAGGTPLGQDASDDEGAAAARSLRNWGASAPADPYGGEEERIRRRPPASNGSYSRGVARLSAAAAAATMTSRGASAPPPTNRPEQELQEEEPGLQWRREIYLRGLERAGGRSSDGAGAAAAAAAAAAPSAGTSTATTAAPWAVAARVSLWARRDLEALLGRGERGAVDVAASVVEGLWREHGIRGVEAAAAAAAAPAAAAAEGEGARAAASAPLPPSSSSSSSPSSSRAAAAVAAGVSSARSLAPILQGAESGRRSSLSWSSSTSSSLSSSLSQKFWRELSSFVESGLTVDAYDRTYRYRRRAGAGGEGYQRQ